MFPRLVRRLGRRTTSFEKSTLGAASALVAVSLALAPLPAHAVDQGHWVPLSPPQPGYQAYLPAAPQGFRSVRWTPLGRFVTTGYEVLRERDGCNITTTALPAVIGWLGGAQIVYQRSRAEFLAENGARATAVLSAKRTGVSGEVLEWANETRRGRTEFYLLDDRLHIFNCFADRGAPTSLIDTFFARLTLLDPDTAAAH